MKKKILCCLGGLVALGLVTVGSIAFLNRVDEPLDPDVKRILDNRPTPTEQQVKAYYFLMGLYSGEEGDPEKRGEELWMKYMKDPKAAEKNSFWSKEVRRRDPWKTAFPSCGAEICSVKYVDSHPETLQSLAADSQRIKDYIKLMHYRTIAPPIGRLENHPMWDLMKIHINLHKLLLVQYSVWAKAGNYAQIFAVMTDSNLYAKSLLAHGSTLDRFLAVANIQANANFLESEIARGAKLKVPPGFLATFQLPPADEILMGAIQHEVVVFHWMENQITSLADFELTNLSGPHDPGSNYKKYIRTNWLFRRNETLNHYYRMSMDSFHAKCLEESNDPKCMPGYDWFSFESPLHFLINPIGRTLGRIAFVNVAQRRGTLTKRLEKIKTTVAGLSS